MPQENEKTEEEIDNEVKSELMLSIQQELIERGSTARGAALNRLAAANPVKAAQALMLYSMGTSMSTIVSKYGFTRPALETLLVEYSDVMGSWKQLGGKLAAKNYLGLTSLEEDLIAVVRERLESGELKVGFKDLKELSVAKAAASREALTARGEASNITEERKVYSQSDYEETLRKAKERIEAAKQAEIVDV